MRKRIERRRLSNKARVVRARAGASHFGRRLRQRSRNGARIQAFGRRQSEALRPSLFTSFAEEGNRGVKLRDTLTAFAAIVSEVWRDDWRQDPSSINKTER